jgi:hypothetical protein
MRELLSPILVSALIGAGIAWIGRAKLFTLFSQEKAKSPAYRRGVLYYAWIVGAARTTLFMAGFAVIMLFSGVSAWSLVLAAGGGYLIAWAINSIHAHQSVVAS